MVRSNLKESTIFNHGAGSAPKGQPYSPTRMSITINMSNSSASVFFLGGIMPNFDLKNIISTYYAKDFSWKNNPNLLD